MPLYEFRCGTCGHEFEELVGGPLGVEAVRCPDCDGAEVEKLISLVAASRPQRRSERTATSCTTST